jgi:hypothetical protein
LVAARGLACKSLPQKRKDSSFSEEKEAKRLLFLGLLRFPCAQVKRLALTKGSIGCPEMSSYFHITWLPGGG